MIELNHHNCILKSENGDLTNTRLQKQQVSLIAA